MTEINWKDIRARLSAPDGMDVKVREGKYKYIDARDVQDRLDDVVGPENWATSFFVIDRDAVVVECQLTIYGVTKADVGYANNPGSDFEKEPFKAAYSDALKRAAVHFGVGRFLYDGAPPAAKPAPQRSAPAQHTARPAAPAARPAGNASGAEPVSAGSRSAPVTLSAAPNPAPSNGPMLQVDAIPPREPEEERVVVAMPEIDRLKAAYDLGLRELAERGGTLSGWSYQDTWSQTDLERYLDDLRNEVRKHPKRRAGAAA